ncbi:hypothetical protein COCNU_14G003410 [Cocos nucifera]|uniref:Uncharacterized protein n=1 Tax=Cocos nucifera TaxID=13894 RepID=A0A8K0NC41_COCNU|nr:hypothetical protein COCNU_14G003410 [Cocos nucifera]
MHKMAAKPLTTEAIALTEKKMDMTLDDIIKMSKKNTSKGKRPLRRPGVLAQRRSNFRGNEFPVTTEIARRAAAMPIRNRGVNWNRPRVAVASVQRKPAADSFGGKDKVVSKQRPQTLDALFANMKEQRMKATSQQTNNRNGRQTAPTFRAQWRGRGGAAPRGAARRFGNYVK